MNACRFFSQFKELVTRGDQDSVSKIDLEYTQQTRKLTMALVLNML